MIDILKYATISKIYTKDLKFYNPDDHKGSAAFCERYGITYMPDVSRNKCYEFLGDKFEKRDLSDVPQCSPADLLFSTATLDKFKEAKRADDVLLVTEKDKIKGVVHIVDYNNEFLYFEFYKLVYYFERNLREFLRLKGETNDSFLKWYRESNGQYNRYEPKSEENAKEKEKERKALGVFQTFFLFDLLEFTYNKKHLSFNKDERKAIRKVRNWVAHYPDILLNEKKEERTEGLYDFSRLEEFVKNVEVFFQHYEILEAALK